MRIFLAVRQTNENVMQPSSPTGSADRRTLRHTAPCRTTETPGPHEASSHVADVGSATPSVGTGAARRRVHDGDPLLRGARVQQLARLQRRVDESCRATTFDVTRLFFDLVLPE